MRCRVRVVNDNNAIEAGRNFLEQLQSLSRNFGVEAGEAGNVTLRARQARNNAISDRIGEAGEHDRYSLRRLLQRSCRRRVCGQYHVWREAYQFCRKGFGQGGIAGAPANIEANVATFHLVQIFKALPKRREALLAIRIFHGTH